MAARKPQSFYFFDFDDNVMFLQTSILIQNTVTLEVRELGTAEYARIWSKLGAPGDWEAFSLFKDSYNYFRDVPDEELGEGSQQHFVSDVQKAVANRTPKEWQAPSWAFFAHACALQRPVSIITARGHAPETIKAGIRHLKETGWIEQEPNYVTVFPVSNETVRKGLGDPGETFTIPTLKKLAIIKSIEVGLEKYGKSPSHQFGMSDDDPHNMQLIIEAMRDSKLAHPNKRFFVFNTHVQNSVKLEVLPIGLP